MGFLSRFENTMEDGIEGAAGAVGRSGLSPVQITKKAEKQMRRERIVGAGKQYAPTLYTVLVSPEDDRKLHMYYPTLAGEVETFLVARAREAGYVMDGHPLVRFITDPDLKRGKFDVVAEMVASAIVEQLRQDEMDRYGLGDGRRGAAGSARGGAAGVAARSASASAAAAAAGAGVAGVGVGASSPRAAAKDASVGAGGVGRHTPRGIAYKSALDDEPVLTRAGAREIGAAERAQNDSLHFEPVDNVVRAAREAERALREEGFEPGPEPAVEMPAISESLPRKTRGAGVNALFGDDGYADDAEADVETVNIRDAQAGGANAASARAEELPEVYLYDEQRDVAYQLAGAPQQIGRESVNEIVVPDINISRVHAEIRREPNGIWVITDLGSTNGIYINGRKVSEAPLRDADMITLGTTTLEFQQLD